MYRIEIDRVIYPHDNDMLVVYYPSSDDYYIQHYNDNVAGPFVSYESACWALQEIEKKLNDHE